MADDWDDLEAMEATSRVLKAAIASGAGEIHLSPDTTGAAIFLVSAERIEFLAHVSAACWGRIKDSLRGLAGIDSWKQTPVNGFGLFSHEGTECQVEVCLGRAEPQEDVVVRITRC